MLFSLVIVLFSVASNQVKAFDENEANDSAETISDTEKNNEEKRVGVGIGTGKIQISEMVLPGKQYELTSISVINTGTVPAEYHTTITYHEQQSEKQPLLEWFSFSPDTYYLEPGQSQLVKVSMNMPLSVEPGDYFAYVEAQPTEKVENGGGAVIGVAAAARLYFTVKPSNILMAAYYRHCSFYQLHKVAFHVAGAT